METKQQSTLCRNAIKQLHLGKTTLDGSPCRLFHLVPAYPQSLPTKRGHPISHIERLQAPASFLYCRQPALCRSLPAASAPSATALAPHGHGRGRRHQHRPAAGDDGAIAATRAGAPLSCQFLLPLPVPPFCSCAA
jgi:hypothetical protein